MSLRNTIFALVCFAFAGFAIPTSAQEPILPGDLIKGSDSAVYYYFGNRYAFPNEDAYFSWYRDFSGVKTVSDQFLASIQLVGNVRIKPGTYMVKIITESKVYFIDNGNELRWIPSETIAAAMYGPDWSTQVRDVSDALFVDYRLGEPLPSDTDDDLLTFSTSLTYGNIGQALRRMNRAGPASLEQFIRHPSITEVTKLHAYGYSASTTEPMESIRAYYLAQSSGWDLLFDDYLETSFGNGYLMNLGQTRDGRFAHRSIAVSVSSSTESRTAVELLEAEFPDGYIAYPRMSTADLHLDARHVFQHGLTTDSLEDIVRWYKDTTFARGWELVDESETGSLEDFASLRRLYFRQPGTHVWLHVEVTQIGESFRALVGDISSV
ncbi:MAG: hypothetical protein NUW08_01080, partial [Candidatus Uhrbacteria bacterium]|nr:hypothetical protein [Candidatus Uhrbacteria bacterium]